MTFFSADAEPPEPSEPPELEPPRWWGPPEDELATLLPVREVLGTTEQASVALVWALVHSDGVAFRVERRLRRGDLPAREWQQLVTEFAEHGMFGELEDPAARLRFGVVLGDGEQVLDSHPFGQGKDPNVMPTHHVLVRSGGGSGGSDRFYSGSDTLWLWPLPPSGPIELVMQWPALGIGEVRVALDGDRILDLAQQVVPLWPER